jgi:hypothetical protein
MCVLCQDFVVSYCYHLFCGLLIAENKSTDDITSSLSMSVDIFLTLTLIMLTSTKWRAPTSDSKWRMGFNSAFKGLNNFSLSRETYYEYMCGKLMRSLQALHVRRPGIRRRGSVSFYFFCQSFTAYRMQQLPSHFYTISYFGFSFKFLDTDVFCSKL